MIVVEHAVLAPALEAAPLALGGRHATHVQGVIGDRRGHVEIAGIPHDIHVDLVIGGTLEDAAHTYLISPGKDGQMDCRPPLAQIPVKADDVWRYRDIGAGGLAGKERQKSEGIW
ncbi:hypothetical protein ACFL6X_00150 [Candidatus Latescibacterota bacterium]